MTYKVEDVRQTKFPPRATKLNGEASPEWINDKASSALYGKVPSGTKISSWIRSGRNRRFGFNLMKINQGKINLTKKNHKSFFAAALCEMEIPKVSIGEKNGRSFSYYLNNQVIPTSAGSHRLLILMRWNIWGSSQERTPAMTVQRGTMKAYTS